jgi:ketosteroid isomerase-like protein
MVAAKNATEQGVLVFFETLSTGDLDALGRLMCEDMSWETMVRDIPGAGLHQGRDKILNEFLAPVRGAFRPGEPKILVDHMVSDGDRAIVETRAQGTKADDGRLYDNLYCWAFEFRDGKVLKIREYMDSLYTAKFWGMIPDGPAK